MLRSIRDAYYEVKYLGVEGLYLPAHPSTTEVLVVVAYGPERCLIDAFRLRRLEGPELGNAALKRWLARRGSQPAELLELAAEFPRTAAPLRRSLEVLL